MKPAKVARTSSEVMRARQVVSKGMTKVGLKPVQVATLAGASMALQWLCGSENALARLLSVEEPDASPE